MKKTILLMIFFFSPFWVSAQSECVLGLVNDPAPGSCSSYTDADGNNLCDLSEFDVSKQAGDSAPGEAAHVSEEELKLYSVAEVAELYSITEQDYTAALSDFLKINISGRDSMLTLHDQNGLCTGVAATIASSLQGGGQGVEGIDPNSLISGSEIKAKKVYEIAEIYGISEEALANALAAELGIKVKQGELIQVLHDNYGLEANRVKEIAATLFSDSVTPVEAEEEEISVVLAPRYRLVQIVLGLLFTYFLTSFLVVRKKMSLLTQRRLWNVLLLLSFLMSALLGLLLIIRINFGWYLSLPFNILYWHVEMGTAMATITFIHISWYWRFYTSMFRRKKSDA